MTDRPRATPVLLAVSIAVSGLACARATPRGSRSGERRSPVAAILRAEDARATTDRDLETLLAGLRSDASEVRRAAVRAVGRLERPALADRVTPLLVDDDPAVRAECAIALGQLFHGSIVDRPGDPAVADAPRFDLASVAHALLGRLGQESNPSVRGALAGTLGRLPYAAISDVRIAEAALARVGPAISPGVTMDAALLGAARGLEALFRLQGRRFADWVPAADTVDRLRGLAALPLSTRSTTLTTAPAGRGVGPAGSDPSIGGWVRRLALAALISRGLAEPQVVEAAAFADDPQLRRLAVLAAGGPAPMDPAAPGHPSTEAASSVVRALADPAPMVRYEALRTLGGSPALECELPLAAVEDPDAHVALQAVDLLGGCTANDGAVRRLEGLIEGLPDAAVRGSRRPGAARASWHRASHALVSLSRQAPGRARRALSRFARHSIWQVRMYAARAAAGLGDAAPLLELIHDPEDNVREATLVGLVALNHPEGPAAVIAALARPDYQLVRTAARALAGRSRERAVVDALLASLDRVTREGRDTSRDPRIAILERLAEFGSREDAPALLPYLGDFDPRVAGEAARTLSGWTGRAHAVRRRARRRRLRPVPH